MPALPLSDEQIEKLRPPKRTWFFHRYVHGLALRVSPPGTKYPRGRKSWYVIYGKTQHRFGSYPGIRIKVAAETAGQLLAKVSLGQDPAADKKAREKSDDTLTLSRLAAMFRKEHFPSLRDTTRNDWERCLEKEIEPRFGTRVMAQEQWKKAEIKKWLAEIKAERGDCAANDVYACMRRLFSWANEEEHIGDWTPFLNLKRPAEKVERERVLSMMEIKKILTWLKTEPLVFRTAWMTFFWTLARHRPVTNMKTVELDLDSAKWTFYDKGKKKGKYRVAPLPTQAVERLRLLQEVNGESEYVFLSGRAKRNSSFETKSYRYQLQLQASLNRCRVATKIDDFKGAHDIRRTMATRLAEEGFADENLIARILGHGLPGVEPHTLIYQRYARIPEQRDALQKLADWLDKVEKQDVGSLSRHTERKVV